MQVWLPERENQKGIEPGDDIVSHDAETVMPLAVDESCRRWLDDIEYAEQQERESLAQRIRAHEKKHQQERSKAMSSTQVAR